VRTLFEIFFYGMLTLLLGWFSPRIFVSTSWPARHKAIFSVLMTVAIFGALAVYRLTTGIDATEKLEEITLCPLYSFAHCPQPAVPARKLHTPVRTFLVFFNYGSAVLGPKARDVAGAAATTFIIKHFTKCLMTGHEDSAEATHEGANPSRTLSMRRMEAFKGALNTYGFFPALAYDDKRASAPFKLTPPDTREPLNRMVMVDCIDGAADW
jgi:hypothetical protein